jgi:hypothetical protein
MVVGAQPAMEARATAGDGPLRGHAPPSPATRGNEVCEHGSTVSIVASGDSRQAVNQPSRRFNGIVHFFIELLRVGTRARSGNIRVDSVYVVIV